MNIASDNDLIIGIVENKNCERKFVIIDKSPSSNICINGNGRVIEREENGQIHNFFIPNVTNKE